MFWAWVTFWALLAIFRIEAHRFISGQSWKGGLDGIETTLGYVGFCRVKLGPWWDMQRGIKQNEDDRSPHSPHAWS